MMCGGRAAILGTVGAVGGRGGLSPAAPAVWCALVVVIADDELEMPEVYAAACGHYLKVLLTRTPAHGAIGTEPRTEPEKLG